LLDVRAVQLDLRQYPLLQKQLADVHDQV
jgi:hypothetical protein